MKALTIESGRKQSAWSLSLAEAGRVINKVTRRLGLPLAIAGTLTAYASIVTGSEPMLVKGIIAGALGTAILMSNLANKEGGKSCKV